MKVCNSTQLIAQKVFSHTLICYTEGLTYTYLNAKQQRYLVGELVNYQRVKIVLVLHKDLKITARSMSALSDKQGHSD